MCVCKSISLSIDSYKIYKKNQCITFCALPFSLNTSYKVFFSDYIDAIPLQNSMLQNIVKDSFPNGLWFGFIYFSVINLVINSLMHAL